MKQQHVFEKKSNFPASLGEIWDFHASPETFQRLAPPMVIARVNDDARQSLTAGELDFTLWFGPLPVRWVASHAPGPVPTSFVDRMVWGPLAYWEHEHIMEEIPGGVRLTDRVAYTYQSGVRGLLGRAFFNRPAIWALFQYRHWITRKALHGLDRSVRPDEPQIQTLQDSVNGGE